MAGDAKKLQPVIIKRVKKGGHAHHGGAWKIAYADFVTAMMAFFLLMWLLGSTTEGDRKGIQDYFNNPVKISMLGGAGSGDSSSVLRGGGEELTLSYGQRKKGDVDAERKQYTLRALKSHSRSVEAEQLGALKARMEMMIFTSERLAQFQSQIRLDMTPDGLRIQIVDDQNRPMFATGSSVVQPYMRELLRTIAGVLAEVPNKLTLEGHTDAAPFGAGVAGYSNWELSSDRANASRRELIAGGLADAQVLRVQGLAASLLYDREQPLNPINRRISIIVMNRDAEDRLHGVATGEAGGAADTAPVPVLPMLPPGLPVLPVEVATASSAPVNTR
jgi:chemotaxis protein MotB